MTGSVLLLPPLLELLPSLLLKLLEALVEASGGAQKVAARAVPALSSGWYWFCHARLLRRLRALARAGLD